MVQADAATATATASPFGPVDSERRELFRQYCARNDQRCAATLHEQLRRYVAKVCQSWLDPREDQEDAVQNTFAYFFAKYNPDDYRCPMMAYIAIIAKFHARAVRLKRIRAAARECPLADDFDTPAQVAPEGPELSRRVRGALALLQPRVRQAVELYYLQGIPARDVAQRLGLTHRSAKQYVFTGIAELRRMLAPRAAESA